MRVRQSFFAQLIRRYNFVSAHGLKLIYGDLNARIHHRLAGEDLIIGFFLFGDPLAIIGSSKNMQLLIEACKALRLTVAHTWFDKRIGDQIYFYAIGASPIKHINHKTFPQLDFCLCPFDWQSKILDVYSSRADALASYHFLVISRVCLDVLRVAVVKQKVPYNVKMCREPSTALLFAHEFDSWFQQIDDCVHIDSTNIDSIDKCLQEAFNHAAQQILSRTQYRPKRPFISMQIVQIIADRNQARIEGNSFIEQMFAKKVRAFVQQNKAQWFSRLLHDGDLA